MILCVLSLLLHLHREEEAEAAVAAGAAAFSPQEQAVLLEARQLAALQELKASSRQALYQVCGHRGWGVIAIVR